MEGLVPKLAKLKRLLADADAETLQALKDFADHPDLPCLAEWLEGATAQAAEFNPFETLGMWHREDVHSRILNWLLGPNGNHGLGDYFLREFLRSSGSSVSRSCADLSNAKSYREWPCVVDGKAGWLDILVLDSHLEVLFAIENKIFTSESRNQLTHYRKALEVAYCHFERYYTFLSPNGRKPQREKEWKYWKPLDYSTILHLIERTINNKDININKEVIQFLQHYADTLRRRIVPETNEIAQLARKVYVKNREVIELIYSHKPDYRAEINQILQKAIGCQQGWALDDTNAKYVRFFPVEWEQFSCFRTGTGTGWPSKAVVLFEFYCTPENASLRLVIAPSKEPIRSTLFEHIKQYSSIFNKAGGSLKDGHLHIHGLEPVLEDSDLNNWDDTTLSGVAKLRQYVADFAQNDFPVMNDIIVECFKEYESGRPGQ